MGSGFSRKQAFGEGGTVIIHTDKTAYLPGEQVTGQIYLQTTTLHPPSRLFMKFEAVEGFHRVIAPSKDKQLEDKSRKFIDHSWCLHQWNKGIKVKHMEIPFSFILPEDLSPSFHQEGATFLAYIVYTIEIKLEYIHTKTNFPTIYQFRKLVIRKPVDRVAKSCADELTVPLHKWGCIPQGLISLRACFEKDLYSYRDVVRATVEIDNSHSNKDNIETQVQLVQVLSLKSQQIFTYNLPIAKVAIPGVKAHDKSEPQIVTFDIPQFKGDEHHIETRTSRWPKGEADESKGSLRLPTEGEFIISKFYLQVECKMSGNKVAVPKISFPIDIRYPDPPLHPLGLKKDWKLRVYEKVDLGLVASKGAKKKIGEINEEKMVETKILMNNAVSNTQICCCA